MTSCATVSRYADAKNMTSSTSPLAKLSHSTPREFSHAIISRSFEHLLTWRPVSSRITRSFCFLAYSTVAAIFVTNGTSICTPRSLIVWSNIQTWRSRSGRFGTVSSTRHSTSTSRPQYIMLRFRSSGSSHHVIVPSGLNLRGLAIFIITLLPSRSLRSGKRRASPSLSSD